MNTDLYVIVEKSNGETRILASYFDEDQANRVYGEARKKVKQYNWPGSVGLYRYELASELSMLEVKEEA